MKFSFVASLLITCFGLLVVLSGIGVISYQVYVWLKFEHWVGLSVRDGLGYLVTPETPTYRWIVNPDSWLGLYRLLDLIPLSLYLVVLGIFISRLLAGWTDSALSGD